MSPGETNPRKALVIKKFSSKDYSGYKKLVNFTEKIFNKGFIDLSDRPFIKL